MAADGADGAHGADGKGAPRSSKDSGASASQDGRAFVRSRIRMFRRIAYAVTASAQIGPAIALSVVAPAPVTLGFVVVSFAVTLVVLTGLVRGERRSWIRTQLLDTPVMAHGFASLIATLMLPVAGALGGFLGIFGVGHAIRIVVLVVYLVVLAMAAWGSSVRRRSIWVAHVDVPIGGLSPDLDGYRIAHVSDLHIGNFDGLARGKQWAARVNALAPDLVAVTGDLVTTGTAFYDDVATVIGEMAAKDGVFVSMGNHDQSDPDALTRLIEARGSRVLRNASEIVSRGSARLVLAGIDDRMTGKDDLERTLAGRPHAVPTILLSHYPDFFDEAADRGVTLVLSGHTHGGQIAVPFASKRFSLSRLARQASAGLHIRGKSRLYVNRGLGTTGPPLRVGVPPEIAVFTLRRA